MHKHGQRNLFQKDTDETRRCCGCKHDLPLDSFHKNAKLCKPCRVEYGKKWYAENRAKRKIQARVNYLQNVQRERKRAHDNWFRKPVAERKFLGRRYSLSRKYGVTLKRYDEMFAAQGGVCKLCGNPPALKVLGVDHHHGTKKVRGLLCNKCNVAVGFIEKNLSMLDKILDYIGHKR